ncbi:MAG: HD domain-containing protein [Deltaproteobacteria bacterium]|nr:HD domain-containing protein [Deltaproteobacteria bacterium]
MTMKVDLPIDDQVLEVAAALQRAGGRAVMVGGIVRDHLLSRPSKDLDVEVYGLELERLEKELSRFGEVIAIGRAFGVLRIKGIDVDFSIPRRDSKRGPGHRGFLVELDPNLDFAAAARRRDLTINSLGVDPLSQQLLDPFDGLSDLRQGILRATDSQQFAEDPLRGLRVAQFRARLEMEPDAELVSLCARLDLSELPGERLFEEFRKLLLKARRPSMGLEFLRETKLLRFFPELQAMVGVPQDPQWHPEGTVWEHTLLVVDEAARLRTGDEREDLVLLFGALAHDIGKPATTVEVEGRIRSPRHDEDGVAIAASFLARLSASKQLVESVGALVRHHLAPALLPTQGAKPKAYRRLARKLAQASVTFDLLYRLASADHLGRTTADALARVFPAGDEYRRQIEGLQQGGDATKDVVLGRHLIARGMKPGPQFGGWLAACRDVQDETGWSDPERILDRVLSG